MANVHPNLFTRPAILLLLLILSSGCKENEGTLAPYTDVPLGLSKINVQDSVFTPNVTWLGGYVSAFGVNLGPEAVLDSTLVALIYAPGNGVKFPLTFGTVPPGDQNLAAQYGGTPLTRLIEDRTYTFWVMKEEAWNQISTKTHKALVIDSNATASVQARNDSLLLSPAVFSMVTKRLDVYINIKDVRVFGRLSSSIQIIASDTCNRPTIIFKVTESDAPDTMLSAIGICEGGDYRIDSRVWEVISADVHPDTTIYWNNDVISSPLQMGQEIPGTAEFITYPPEGLKRQTQYYLWIANKSWDRTTRTRAIPNYAFATFTVW